MRQFLQLSSEDECDTILSMEKGYDADLESQPEDRKFCRGVDLVPEREHFASLFRLLVELLVRSYETDSGKEITAQVLAKLLQTLRGNQEATMVVCNEVRTV